MQGQLEGPRPMLADLVSDLVLGQVLWQVCVTAVRICLLSGMNPMTISRNRSVWICLKHQRMMLVKQFFAAPKWRALQLAKAFRAAESSVELRLAIINAVAGTAARLFTS